MHHPLIELRLVKNLALHLGSLLILLAEIALLAVQRPHAEVASDLTARRGISNTAVSST